MSLVRLLGFTTLACGCVVGRYREVATSREVSYVEEKGKSCGSHGHRRNHTVAAERFARDRRRFLWRPKPPSHGSEASASDCPVAATILWLRAPLTNTPLSAEIQAVCRSS